MCLKKISDEIGRIIQQQDTMPTGMMEARARTMAGEPVQYQRGPQTTSMSGTDSASWGIKEVKRRLKAGRITKSQADAMIKAIRTGNPGQWQMFYKGEPEDKDGTNVPIGTTLDPAEDPDANTVIPEHVQTLMDKYSKGMNDEEKAKFFTDVSRLFQGQGQETSSPPPQVPQGRPRYEPYRGWTPMARRGHPYISGGF